MTARRMLRTLGAASVGLFATALVAGCGTAAQEAAPEVTVVDEVVVTDPAEEPEAEAPAEDDEYAALDTGHNPDADVTLEMWAWDPGMDQVVRAWNEQNPHVQVNLVNPAGGDELVSRMITAHQAGGGPDIGKIEFQALPSLAAAGAVLDITEYVQDVRGNFDDNAWDLVTFDGHTFGLPQDFAPLMMFYRPEVFEEAGVAVPTTWAEFADAARAIHEHDPNQYITTFSAGDPGWFAGLAQQAGANWWTTEGDTWTVDIDDEASRQVAEYWQGLIDEGVVKSDPFWTPQWNTEMNNGTYAVWISGAWAAAQIRGIAPDLAGEWRIAPLPSWNAGDETTGIWGGSSLSVMANSAHPAEAAEFIKWINASDEGLALQITEIGVYPAANNGRALPELDSPPDFFVNQPDYYDVISEAAQHARSFPIWGPNANVTFNTFRDSFAEAIQNGTPFADALTSMQNDTVSDMNRLGFSVAE